MNTLNVPEVCRVRRSRIIASKRPVSLFEQGTKAGLSLRGVLGQLKCGAAGPPGQLNFTEKKVFDPNGAVYSQTESASVM